MERTLRNALITMALILGAYAAWTGQNLTSLLLR